MSTNPPMPEDSDDVNAAMARLTRRGFAFGAIVAAIGGGGLYWLNARAAREQSLPWPLRRMLEANERLGETLFDPRRPSPEFPRDWAQEPRVNGRRGLASQFDPASWRLHITGTEHALPLAAIRDLPRYEMTTELMCVEGWSQIVHWAGARLADFAGKYRLAGTYVSLVTPDRKYYVGLDIDSALHPQTLLCYEMNGQPLAPLHGAPLRLVTTVKYGYKSIKRIGTIGFTNERPRDTWAEEGYDWYAGL